LDVMIYKAKKEDVSAIHDIEKKCFSNPWTFNMLYSDIVNNVITEYFVARDKCGNTVGFSGMYMVVSEAHITNIAVLSEKRNKGIACRLVSAMIKQAERAKCEGVTLEVRVSNEAAINLYQKFGFKIEGIRKAYYTDNGEDAYIMWLNFDGRISF